MAFKRVKDTKEVTLDSTPITVDTVLGKNYGTSWFSAAAYTLSGTTLYLTKKYAEVTVDYTIEGEQNAPLKSDGTSYLPPVTCGPDGKLQGLDEAISAATDKALEAINDPTKGIAANIGKIKSEISTALNEVNSKISDLAKPESKIAQNMQKDFEKLSAKLNDPEFGKELSDGIKEAGDKLSGFLSGVVDGASPAGSSLTNSINSALSEVDTGAISSQLSGDIAKAQSFLSGSGDGSLTGELSKAFGSNLGDLSNLSSKLPTGSSVSGSEVLNKYNASKQKAIAEFEKLWGSGLGKTGTSVDKLMGILNDPSNSLEICKFVPNVDLVESGKDETTGAPIFKDIIKGTPLTVPETDAVKEKTQVDLIPKEAVKVETKLAPVKADTASVIKEEVTAEVLNNSTNSNKIVVKEAPVITTPAADKKETITFTKRIYTVDEPMVGQKVSFTLRLSNVSGNFVWMASLTGVRGIANAGGITDEGHLEPGVGLPQTAPEFWAKYTRDWKKKQDSRLRSLIGELNDMKASQRSNTKKSPEMTKNSRVQQLENELALIEQDAERAFDGKPLKNQISITKVYGQYKSSESKLQANQNQLSSNPNVRFTPTLLSESKFFQQAREDNTLLVNTIDQLIITYKRRIKFAKNKASTGKGFDASDAAQEIKKMKEQIEKFKQLKPAYPIGK